nr:unnamed protein product [Callosobruchus chinensis]
MAGIAKNCYSLLRYANKHIMTKFTKKTLCEELDVSKILYNQNTSKRLQKIQNCCCCFVKNLTAFSYTSTCINSMEWLKVEKLFRYSLLTIVHKINLSRTLY